MLVFGIFLRVVHLLVRCAIKRDTWGRQCANPSGGISPARLNKLGDQIMNKLRETFLQQLMDIYDAEKQLVKALPKVAKAATHHELKSAIESHLEETEGQVERLDQVFDIIGEPAKGKKCRAMTGLLEEGQDTIKEKEGD